MGQSTNAYLYYGFDFLGEDIEYEDESIEDELMYRINDGEFYDLTRGLDIDVDNHCSTSCPTWFICIESTKIIAHRGYPKDVDVKSLFEIETSIHDDLLKDFCEKHRIPYQQPGWHLASFWEC